MEVIINHAQLKLKKSIGYIKDNKSFSCIDTPGTNDLNKTNKEINKQIYDFLIKNEEIITIKGIFMIMNFQEESIDKSHFDTLLNMLELFPFKKKFWENVTICFTHFYGSPGINKNKIKAEREGTLKEFFDNLISYSNQKYSINKIDFQNIKILYLDMYDKEVKELKKEMNTENDINKNMELQNEINILEKYNSEAKSELLNRIKELASKESICQSGNKKHETNKSAYKKNNEETYDLYTINLDTLSFYNENQVIVKNIYQIIGKPQKKETIKKTNLKYILAGSVAGAGGIIGVCLIGGFFIPGINIAEGTLIGGIITAGGPTVGGITDTILYHMDKYTTLLRDINNGTIEDIQKFEE